MTTPEKQPELTVDEAMELASTDAAELAAKLRPAPSPEPDPAKKPVTRWWVVRQYNHQPDVLVCEHRWEWLADLCAYRRTASHPSEIGAQYTTVRHVTPQAETPEAAA